MWKVTLRPRARRTMRALIEVVMPRGSGFDFQLQDEMLESVEETLAYIPLELKLLFPVGLLLLEYGTFLFMGRLTPFSRLSGDLQKRYIDGWVTSRFMLRRELIKGIKALAVMAYFENPQVKAKLGFMPEERVEKLGEYRLERYGDEIRRIQESTS